MGDGEGADASATGATVYETVCRSLRGSFP
jgi:hypothetical protein